MIEPRNSRDNQSRECVPIAASETLRIAAEPKDAGGKGEERLSIFWRVFGGTVLSIIALAAVTVYQQFNNALNDLRANINHINEYHAGLVKTDEFNARLTSVWNSMKALQELQTNVTALKERAIVRDQQAKREEELRDAIGKEVQGLTATVTALKERAMVQDEHTRIAEERKELLRELQQLRERLATIEGRSQAIVPAKAEQRAAGDQ